MKITQAVALCRVSTSKQRIFGNSLDAQEQRIVKAAELLGVMLPNEYIWRKDVSSRKGKNLKRKDLLEIFDTCKANRKIKYFIVDEPDRFMRSIEEYFWWKVEFRQIGVRLIFAHKPLVSDGDQNAIFDELIDVYRAESSNHERTKKANEKMQARIDLGYYPGYCHTAYVKSEEKGLHVPKEPEHTLLRTAYLDVVYGRKSMREALIWLNNSNFRLKSGKRLDMTKFRRILQEPYYYGAVKMGSFTVNENGLHKPMVSKEEFEIAERIAKGLKAKFTVKRHNPSFPMNGLLCEQCFIVSQDKSGKFTGYEHNNGKPLATRKYYKRYRCRGCGMPFTLEEMHSEISNYLSGIKLDPSIKTQLKDSLRKAWSSIENDKLALAARVKRQQEAAESQKLKLIMALAENPELKTELKEAIESKSAEIVVLKEKLSEANDIEQDFIEFFDFAIDYVNNLKEEWWHLDHEDRLRCEQLLFPQYLRINKNKKVSTPEISYIYRYKPSKKTPVGVLNAKSGGSGGT